MPRRIGVETNWKNAVIPQRVVPQRPDFYIKGEVSKTVEEVLRLEGQKLEIAPKSNFCIWLHKQPPRKHAEFHYIYWLGNKKNDLVNQENTWRHPASLYSLASDLNFGKNLEYLFDSIQTFQPNVRFHHGLGFPNQAELQLYEQSFSPNRVTGLNRVLPFGIQTQERMHIHLLGAYQDYSDASFVSASQNLDQFAAFANISGNIALNYFEQQFKNFGTQFSFFQNIYNPDTNSSFHIERPMFGFDNWNEAFQASLEMVDTLRPLWIDYLNHFIHQNYENDGLKLNLAQSIIPNMTIMLPTESDRKSANAPEPIKSKWWVQAFPNRTPNQILENGAVIIRN